MSRWMRNFTRCECGALLKNLTAKKPFQVCRMCGALTGDRPAVRVLPTPQTPRQVFPKVPQFDPVAARVRWSMVR